MKQNKLSIKLENVFREFQPLSGVKFSEKKWREEMAGSFFGFSTEIPVRYYFFPCLHVDKALLISYMFKILHMQAD